ncbi:MAG: 4'-phosphopantetheinyl transferase superfamily protein [Acidimicrobiaceae bacterium]|nr:4'-phosphopantetheinyl transferase superfamily protein [Acidimicrobiaceae bacterium]
MNYPRLVVLRDEDPVHLRQRTRNLPGRGHQSRSYADPLSVAAWWTSAVGVDVVRPVNDDHFSLEQRSFRDVMLSPLDLEALTRTPDISAWDIWSSKEAAAKAMGNPLSYIPHQHFSPALWPNGEFGKWRVSRIDNLPDDYLGWVVFELSAHLGA